MGIAYRGKPTDKARGLPVPDPPEVFVPLWPPGAFPALTGGSRDSIKSELGPKPRSHNLGAKGSSTLLRFGERRPNEPEASYQIISSSISSKRKGP